MPRSKQRDSRGPTKAEREERWRDEVELWAECGLTQAEFCRRRSRSLGAFRWWVRELKRRGPRRRRKQRAVSATNSATTPRVRRTQEEIRMLIEEYVTSGLTQKAFAESKGIARTVFARWLGKYGRPSSKSTALVPVRIRDSEPAQASILDGSGVEVILSAGHTLRVYPGFDADTLTRLIRVLEETC